MNIPSWNMTLVLSVVCNCLVLATAGNQETLSSPKTFEIVEQKSQSILMRWDTQPEKSYMVQATYANTIQDSCVNGTNVKNSTFLFTSTSDDKPFLPRTKYKLTLCTVDKTLAMSLPVQREVTTGPPAPTNVNLSGEKHISLTVNWADSDTDEELPVIKYEVKVRETLDQSVEPPHLVDAGDAGDQNRFVIPDLRPNCYYTVTVTSFTNDAKVFSDESRSVSRPTAPDKVFDLRVIYDLLPHRIIVDWRKPVGGNAIVGYSVIWGNVGGASSDGGSSDLILHDPKQESYCYITSPVNAHTEYQITVTTSNDGGNSFTTKIVQTSVSSISTGRTIQETRCAIYSTENFVPTSVSTDETTSFSSTPAPESDPVSFTSHIPTDSTAAIADDTRSSSTAVYSQAPTVSDTRSSSTAVYGQAPTVSDTRSSSTAVYSEMSTVSDSTTLQTTSCNQSGTIAFAEPPEPIFNASSTLTSITVEWLPMVEDVDYYIIESDPLGSFATVRTNFTSTNHTIYDVTPYTEYTVLMYSVVTSSDGEEIRSTARAEQCSTFAQVSCQESTLTHLYDDVIVTFPLTHAGYTNSSIEVCSAESQNEGGALGTRKCSLEGEWLEPLWLSSCSISLQILASTNITTDDERHQVASDLVLLTSNPSSLTSEDLQNSVTTIEIIVSAEELEQSTSSLVVESVGNILSLPGSELQANHISPSLLFSLDDVASKVKVQEGEEYQSVTNTLALAVVSIVENTDKLGYLQRSNPHTEEYGFSHEQFQVFSENLTDLENGSRIVVPQEAIALSQNGRVSFYAFLDDKIFQDSNNHYLEAYGSTIPPEARVHSGVILSASIIGRLVTNLKENVTMIFETNQAGCESLDNHTDCGKQFCGFWNESSILWSDAGCTLTRMTEESIECQCNHLTNFAALFAHGDSEGIRNDFALDIVTLVGCGISLIAIIMTIISISVAWQSGKLTIQKRTLFVMLNLALALFFLYGFLMLSFLDEVTNNNDVCTAVAIILHFALFSSLSWMMVEAIYVYIGTAKPLYFRSELTDKRVWLVSALLGWGFPAIFVAFSAGLATNSYGSAADDLSKTCWISPDMMFYLIIIPAIIILTINVIIYCVIVKTFVTRKFGQKSGGIISGKNIAFSITLFLIFGITWIFGFLIFGSSAASLVFAYIFTITTSLQGFFLFILFVVRNKEIRMSVAQEVQSFHSKIFDTDHLTMASSVIESSSISSKSPSGKWVNSSR